MRKLYRPFLKGSNWILGGLVSLLGFSACANHEDMYGSPYISFSLKGKVQNEAQKGIPDMEIKIASVQTSTNQTHIDMLMPPVQTDSRGEFSVDLNEKVTKKLRVYVTDIDGNKNGSYAKDSVDVDIRPESSEKQIKIELKEIKEYE